MRAILRISGNEPSRPTTSPKADYDPEMLQAPSRLKLSFCIQQGNIAFQNDISQKTVRLQVLS